jgi:hypothetical protein
MAHDLRLFLTSGSGQWGLVLSTVFLDPKALPEARSQISLNMVRPTRTFAHRGEHRFCCVLTYRQSEHYFEWGAEAFFVGTHDPEAIAIATKL